MASSRITVECTNVRKAYRRGTSVSTVLIDVDLEVKSGECIVLAGPSGSGKTTLLSILGCTLRADEGKVHLLGHDVSTLSSSKLATFRRDRIGFLFQRFHLIRGLSAVENVSVPLMLAGVAEKEARRQAAERLGEVGLADFIKNDPRKMSVGQCQRVALARAVVNRPDILLADEPTASLDASSGQAAMQLIRKIVDKDHRTAIIVTHDTRVFEYADRVLQLSSGRLVTTKKASQLDARVIAATQTPSQLLPKSIVGKQATEVSQKSSSLPTDPWIKLGRDFASRYKRLTTDN